MPNQYVNKVVINDLTRIDLTGDTVTADKLMRGYTAHDRSGAPITGTHDDLTVEPLPVTENGTYTAPAGKAYSPVTVAVPSPETQTRTATPSLSTQTITPDSGKLLSGVTVNPITASLLASLDPDFNEANIKSGVDLFGKVGTMPSFYAGSFTPANTGSNITVSHELGKTPSFCAYFYNNFTSAPPSNSQLMAFGSTQNQYVFMPSSSAALSMRSITAGDGQYIRSANATSIVFTASSSSPKHYWVVGGSYIFVVW